MTASASRPQPGVEYVYGIRNGDGSFTPITCNSQHNPARACRVTPVRVGPKWSYALLSGSDKPKKIATDGLLPIDEAKAGYRASFELSKGRPDWRTAEFIDQCVEKL